ncbi:chemotaxis protein CheW [Caulobacter sp. D4A]|uniref:chemotaxis protein CheW n=1 Tax=unclassified Caulobacter TaxID=2648921 RepID=UPI000D73A2FA|nr:MULTISPECIES: chemotaxis protein CheW [unclassified Caulobacter]PXA90442.1 chemotaxis protein CheW [Caulobacter sp. D4A]PXA96953.1 chemotaxis protein CheW [Caulobacter sp. D5]
MASNETHQRLTVRAGGARVAMAADGVAEVIRTPRITRMPHGPPGLLGVTHLRGLVLPVVSLGALLGDEVLEEARAEASRVVVLRRDPPIGLAVEAIEALKSSETDGAEAGHGRLLLDDGDGARWFDLDAALQDRFSAFRAVRRAPEREVVARSTAAAAELAFLNFVLAGQDYALALDAVAEVMAVPNGVVALPRTEAVLIGVFELRDEVLPVVSLRALLGLAERDVQAHDRIVVVRIGDRRLALLVDRISVILRASRDAVGPAPSLFNRASGEARIDSVLRLPDGRGLVSILAPERVLSDERVAQLLAETNDQKDTAMASATSATARERFLVIRLGDETYGLPIAAVDEVVRLPETLTRLPKAPAYVQGVMSLRGRVIPVIDQRKRFAVRGEAAGETRRVVVVTVDGLQAGFAVDAVSRILEVEAGDLMPAPELSGDGDRLFDRAAKVEREEDVILLIDTRALLERAETDLLRDLTARSPAS